MTRDWTPKQWERAVQKEAIGRRVAERYLREYGRYLRAAIETLEEVACFGLDEHSSVWDVIGDRDKALSARMDKAINDMLPDLKRGAERAKAASRIGTQDQEEDV